MKIIIVGAGVIGLSTAFQLAQAGAKVHILDPRPPGHGASLAALGALWPAGPLINTPFHSLHRQSLAHFESFLKTITAASHRKIVYGQLGRIEILNSAKALAHAKEEAVASPQTLAVIDYAAAKSMNPGLAPFHHNALHCRTTAQVNVHELIAALTCACEKSGVIFQPTPALDLHQNANRITAIETADGSLKADAFLIAAGTWTPTISKILAQAAPIRPVKGQGIAVEMPQSRPLATIIKSGTTYLIPWQNEILIGATTEPAALFDETPTSEAAEQLHTAAARILPELHTAKILRHWAGLRPQNPRKPHLPIMGPHPDFPNLFLSAGHYKTGIGLAPLAGELIAKSILESRIPELLIPFLPKQNPERKRVPTTPITDKPSPANP